MTLYWTMKLLAMFGAAVLSSRVIDATGLPRLVRWSLLFFAVLTTALLFDVALVAAPVKVAP